MHVIQRCLAVLLVLAAGVAHASDPQAMLADALKDKQIPAMGMLIVRGGQVSAVHVAGVRASDSPQPVTADDMWNIGSNGKSMTATLIARLVEQGKLAWDTPLTQLLPDLAATMQPGYRKATLVDLLSHHAGLPPNADENWINARYGDTRPLTEQRRAYVQLALSEPPLGPAPAPMAYSNSGAIVAAVIAERVTGKPFEELIQSEVFGPLGMRVIFGPTDRGQPLAHGAGAKPLTGERAGNPLFLVPDGEMAMSLRDWARYAIDQMAGERGQGKLLSAASYRLLHAKQGGDPSAMGWGVRGEGAGRMLMHAGSNGNWHALILIAPERDTAFLMTANAGEGSSAEAAQMAMMKTLMAELAQ